MAKVSRETASHVEDIGVLVSRSEEVDGTTIEFTSFREDADATPFFEGLPDGRCQSRHWGYVLQGRLTFRYADRDEVYEAGDAYYAPPGHIPVVTAGTEVVEFSPTDEYAKTQAVLARNLAAAQAARGVGGPTVALDPAPVALRPPPPIRRAGGGARADLRPAGPADA